MLTSTLFGDHCTFLSTLKLVWKAFTASFSVLSGGNVLVISQLSGRWSTLVFGLAFALRKVQNSAEKNEQHHHVVLEPRTRCPAGTGPHPY